MPMLRLETKFVKDSQKQKQETNNKDAKKLNNISKTLSLTLDL